MANLRDNATFTLYVLEMEMPPYFLDIMIQLVLHVVDQLDLLGPIHVKWMYTMERMNKVFMSYVRNMATNTIFNILRVGSSQNNIGHLDT